MTQRTSCMGKVMLEIQVTPRISGDAEDFLYGQSDAGESSDAEHLK